jgi:hypothetical protein
MSACRCKRIISKGMLEYCKLDTLAMVEIWRHFRGVVSGA